MTTIAQTLASLQIGQPVTSSGLTMFPLLQAAPGSRNYLLLDEALESGLADVTEISEGGSVPELLFLNRSDHDILLVDGEELVGAKQNRVINLSIMVGARTQVTIPVSCVEMGRWSWQSKRFSAGKRNLHASARSAKMRGISESLERDFSRASAEVQSEIWRSVDEKLVHYCIDSGTSALHDLYESTEEQLLPVRSAFTAVESQIGTAFAVAGRLIGIDLFDDHTTLAKMLPKLVDSYAFDALEWGVNKDNGSIAQAAAADVAKMLEQITQASASEYAAVGKGTDLRIRSDRLNAAALVVDGRVAHFSAFSN